MSARIRVPQRRVAAFCQKHRIRRLSLFGSVLRDDFGPSSDVDVLVEFLPGVRFGYLGLAEMEVELGAILGRRADIHAPQWLKPWVRDDVMDSAELVHESSQ